MEGEENLIIPLLLCGQWTEAEGDQVVLEQLCGRKYEQIGTYKITAEHLVDNK